MKASQPIKKEVYELATIAGVMRCCQNVTLTTYPLLGSTLLGMNAPFLGLVATAGGLSTSLTMGLISAKLNPKSIHRSLVVGLGLLSIFSGIFAIANGKVEFILASVVGGVGGGLCLPALTTLISWEGRERKSQALAVFTVALAFSLLFGPLLASVLLTVLDSNLRLVLAVFSGVLFLVTLLSAFFRSKPNELISNPLRNEEIVAVMEDSVQFIEISVVSPPLEKVLQTAQKTSSWKRVIDIFVNWTPNGISKSALRYAIVNQVAYMVPFVAVVTFGGIFFRSIDHFSLTSITLLYSCFYGASLTFRLLIARLAPLSSPLSWCRSAVVISLLGLILISRLNGIGGAVVGLLLLGIPHGILYPTTLALLGAWVRTP